MAGVGSGWISVERERGRAEEGWLGKCGWDFGKGLGMAGCGWRGWSGWLAGGVGILPGGAG